MNTNSEPKYILGISCFYHDSAAAIIRDGRLIAAAAEERFSRKKHDDSFPGKSVSYCLSQAGINAGDLTGVVFYEKPILKFERILAGFINSWPHEFRDYIRAMSAWFSKKLWIKSIIRKELNYAGPVYFSDHHMSHAASAFFVSPFERAAILSVDGVGEWATAAYGLGNGHNIEILKEIRYPGSLGLLYSAITHFLGFSPNSDEYKVMGLAPYGKPVFVGKLKEIFDIYSDGSFKIRTDVFGGDYNIKRTETDLERLLGFKKRVAEGPLEDCHKNLAASLQELTNEVMVKLAKHIRETTGEDNLCMAGGVALNCTANSEILKKAGFKNIFIQPAAGDDGGALGAAYYLWNQIMGQPRGFVMDHAFWGPEFIDYKLSSTDDGRFSIQHLETEELINKTAGLISEQKVVGWFQGRMEWGPRALGNRSILADPRNPDNWRRVNFKIKFRESFRPFAPAVLEEYAGDYFDTETKSRFMLFTAPVKNKIIPAVTHVNDSARIQTVDAGTNPLFHKLLNSFLELTGCPVLINTSFNIRGEPVVCTPEDALDTFMKTDMDALVIGNHIIIKK